MQLEWGFFKLGSFTNRGDPLVFSLMTDTSTLKERPLIRFNGKRQIGWSLSGASVNFNLSLLITEIPLTAITVLKKEIFTALTLYLHLQVTSPTCKPKLTHNLASGSGASMWNMLATVQQQRLNCPNRKLNTGSTPHRRVVSRHRGSWNTFAEASA